MNFSKTFLFNKAGADLRVVPDLIPTLKATGKLPEELNDTFVVTEYQAADGLRYILDWA